MKERKKISLFHVSCSNEVCITQRQREAEGGRGEVRMSSLYKFNLTHLKWRERDGSVTEQIQKLGTECWLPMWVAGTQVL